MFKKVSDILKTVFYGGGGLCLGIWGAVLLMLMVYSLPVERIKTNVMQSAKLYDFDGSYPQLIRGYEMSQLDGWTDSIMLLNAIYSGAEKTVEKAMKVFRTEYRGEAPVTSLEYYANNVSGDTYNVSYSRYWHGYLVILKPLLFLFNLSDIRAINMFVQIALISYILWHMGYGHFKYSCEFIVSILMLNPVAISLSFQFSTVYYLMLLSVIYILKHNILSEKEGMFLLFNLGILTAFFDFLTYPLVTLGYPLVLLLEKEDSWTIAVRKVISHSLIWSIGYLGMWCGKWVIGSILLNENLFIDALGKAAVYTSMEYQEKSVQILQIISNNMKVINKMPIIISCLLISIYYIRRFIRSEKVINLKQRCLCFLPFILVSLIPFCWYLVAGTHSYVHYWFTYRELSVSIFALLVGIEKCMLTDSK